MRVKLRVPPDWAAGSAEVRVTLEPDAVLAALNRGAALTASLEVPVE